VEQARRDSRQAAWDDFSIDSAYQQEYRGVVEHYRLAYNLHQFS